VVIFGYASTVPGMDDQMQSMVVSGLLSGASFRPSSSMAFSIGSACLLDVAGGSLSAVDISISMI
jgi:hypothetical protein